MLVGLFLALGCGPSDETSVADPRSLCGSQCAFNDPLDEVEPNDELDRDQDELDPPPPPMPRVSASPQSLMFYGDMSSADGLEPKSVVVFNSTQSTVLVTNVYVVDTSDLDKGGDAEYFEATLDSPDSPLSPGEERSIWVSFNKSSQQRSALLVIETTHPSFTSLVVSLSGKYFNMN